MKFISMKQITSAFVAGLMLTALVGGGTASAIGEGQIEGGDIYRIKNITKNTGFSDPNSADKCETVQYKIRMHNPGPGVVGNVNVKVNLPTAATTSNVSTVTITGTNMQPTSTTDTATLNLASALAVSYSAGSTELLDTNSNVLNALPDGITGGGVNIGNVGVSLNEIKFVQFKATTECPPAPAYTCDTLGITVGDNRTIKISAFQATAVKDVTFTNAVISWGDNSAQLTAVNPVGQSHQYGKDGTYTITATAHFALIANGQDLTATGPQCTQQVTFNTNKPPVVTPPAVTPPAPGKLVDTGPGEVAALFGATSAIGAVAHRWMLGRRLSRQ